MNSGVDNVTALPPPLSRGFTFVATIQFCKIGFVSVMSLCCALPPVKCSKSITRPAALCVVIVRSRPRFDNSYFFHSELRHLDDEFLHLLHVRWVPQIWNNFPVLADLNGSLHIPGVMTDFMWLETPKSITWSYHHTLFGHITGSFSIDFLTKFLCLFLSNSW